MNSLLFRQVDELLARATGRRALGCEGALRVGAATLCNGIAGEITATIVVCAVDAADVESFEALVAEISDEFGLEATISQHSGSRSVRFTCPAAAVVHVVGRHRIKALLARALAR
jgi:hypothetical protein